MKIVQISTEAGLADLADTWRQLVAACPQASVNATFEWVRLWWEHFAGDRQLCVLTAEDGGHVVGIAPLMIDSSSAVKGLAKRRTICFLGQGASDYGDFIVPERKAEVLGAFVGYLHEQRQLWDHISLREIREDSPCLAALLSSATEAGLECRSTESTSCLQVDLSPGWETYYAGVRAKFRSDVRRRLGKLEALGPVSLVRHTTADEALWQDLLQVNEKHLDEKNKQNLRKDLDFLRRLAEVMAAADMLDIALLKVGPRTAAFNIGLRFKGVVYHWRVGFDPELYKFAPGRLLIRFLLEDCAANGISELDFMRGTEEYKRAWASGERRNLNVDIDNNQLSSRMKTLLRRTLSSQEG